MKYIGYAIGIVGMCLLWLGGYMRGLEVGKIRGRIEYRNIQRWKREG